jgi:glucosyl-dolichyl phosphate glucuronosyltransferase
MKISVIIPTYSLDRFQDLTDAISSLIKQTFTNTEIIVVVDRNESLYLKIKDYFSPSIRVSLSALAGASNARNIGVKMATGEIIAFIDDDVVVTDNWLSMIVRHYNDPSVIGAGGCIKPFWVSHNQKKLPEELYWLIGCTSETVSGVREVRNNFGGNCSFRKEIFDYISFSKNFQNEVGKTRGTEDTEIGIKVLQKFHNRKIVFDPEAIVYHKIFPYRTSLKYIFKRAYSEGTSKAYIATLYKDQLSTEQNYLLDLFTHYLPKRLKQLIKGKDPITNINNVFLIVIVAGITIFGYITKFLELHERFNNSNKKSFVSKI